MGEHISYLLKNVRANLLKKDLWWMFFCEELKAVGKISFVLDAFDIMTVQLEKPAAGGLGLSIVGR